MAEYGGEHQGFGRQGRGWQRGRPEHEGEYLGYGRERFGWDWERGRSASEGDHPEYDRAGWDRERSGRDGGQYGREGASGAGGPYAGRGPKGYQRSDARIHEDVCDRLTDHPQIDASEIEVEVQHGEVTLTGTVDSRYVKRLAEDVAETVSGVTDVHNRLRVAQGQRGMPGQPSGRNHTLEHDRTARTV
jgi:hypothetical protein